MPKSKGKGKAVDSASSRSHYHHVKRSSHHPSRVANLPRSARYLLVVFSSLFLSSSLLTVFSSHTAGHLAGVSKHLEEWWEIGGLILWRATELAFAWIFGFDGEQKSIFSPASA
jgi:hypothetical protein